jgi:poly(3-hydroxybutyrate) depolymerase
MAVILGATYPDLVGAIAVGAGGEYKAAEDAVMGVKAMQLGGPDPDLQGTAARDAMGAYERRVRVIVFHGDLDLTVRPVNADQIVTQWAQTNDWVDDGLDDASVDDAADATRAGQVPGGHAYDVSCYDDAEGRPLLEKWIVHGMRHAWSGGDPDEAFTDPAGPDASAELWRYFSESGSGCDG